MLKQVKKKKKKKKKNKNMLKKKKKKKKKKKTILKFKLFFEMHLKSLWWKVILHKQHTHIHKHLNVYTKYILNIHTYK